VGSTGAEEVALGLSLGEAAAKYGDAPALLFDERTLTWSDVAARAQPPASATSAPLALVARRDESTILEMLGAIDAAVPLVPLSARSTEAEREAQLMQLAGDEGDEPPMAYVFTSGSTGVARAVKLSRRAFLASAEASASILPLSPGDRWLLAMPLSHVGGLSILVRALHAGAAVVVAPEGRWDAADTVLRMERHGVTHASFVPTMLARILGEGLAPPRTLSAVLIGGAPAGPTLLANARDAGWPVLPTYGLTEACSQVATRRPGDLGDQPGRIGAPLPGVEVEIVDSEILIRGPMLFDGYVNHDDGVDPEGWFATGDLGALAADGSLEVWGRRDDLIITGGENVHPAEVEAVLTTHPAVTDACVFGLPDPEWGEIVAAAVVCTNEAFELEAWIEDRCAPHRRPRRLFRVEALERTPSGKVDRLAMRAVAGVDDRVEGR